MPTTNTFQAKLKDIWHDIRHFKNLELYLILLVIVALLVMDIFGISDQLALTEALLAGIAVLIYGQLDMRHKGQAASDKFEALAKQISGLRERQGDYVRVFPSGRSSSFDFAAFLARAQSEIVVIGISLTAFGQRFVEMPASDFKDVIADRLASGVNLKCLILDSTSDAAHTYAADRNEPDIIRRVVSSKRLLTDLSKEFRAAKLAGTMTIHEYPHLPYSYLVLVDPQDDNGSAILSPYMYETTRAETPIYHFDKATNPTLYNRYHEMASALIQSS